jgi:predicted metalloendopeptidase
VNLLPTNIRIGNPQYFAMLSHISSTTSRTVWHAYFRWNIAMIWLPYLHPNIDPGSRVPISSVPDFVVIPKPERRQRCLKEVDKAMGLSIDAFFKHYASGRDDILNIRQLADNILDEFANERLETLDWLDYETGDAVRFKGQLLHLTNNSRMVNSPQFMKSPISS